MAASFPSDLVEEVRELVDIVDVISEHVELRRSGARYVGLCPFHSEKTPSFSVDREKQLYHCFGCQAGGDVFTFVMQRTGLAFPQAVEELAHRVGLDTSRFAPSAEEQRRQRRRRELMELHELVAKFYIQVLRSAAGRGARAYLQRRHITPATAERFGLGYAPAADGFVKFLSRQGVEQSLAMEAGLLGEGRDGRPPYPRFRDRLMFPIWDRAGRVIGFGGRLLRDMPRAPKYLNSPETPLFSKRRTVYGVHLAATAAKAHGHVVVVEGYTDCLRLSQHGVENVVATLGTAFTEQQGRLLHGLAETAFIAFDADAAGQAATMRSLDLLASTGMHVAVVRLPDGLDPDDYVGREGIEAWKERVDTAQPLLEYKLTEALSGASLDTVEGRVRAVRAAARVLQDVRSPVALEGYIAMVAEQTGFSVPSVEAEMRTVAAGRRPAPAPRHSMGKIRHNNKGFRRPGNEQTSRDRMRGGERLSYAEHVILRHLLAGHRAPSDVVGADGEQTPWSSPETAAAAVLLRDWTGSGRDPGEWLASLPMSPGAALLRKIWADEVLAETPWDDAWLVWKQQQGLQRLLRLERDLQGWADADGGDTAVSPLVRLLIEYKILRSELLGKQA